MLYMLILFPGVLLQPELLQQQRMTYCCIFYCSTLETEANTLDKVIAMSLSKYTNEIEPKDDRKSATSAIAISSDRLHEC
jgi:hypothetical protein